jgi:hypothetical protein
MSSSVSVTIQIVIKGARRLPPQDQARVYLVSIFCLRQRSLPRTEYILGSLQTRTVTEIVSKQCARNRSGDDKP